MSTAGTGRRREVAIFGGSFNPPHIGHVHVIAQVLATEAVDGLWLLPTHTHAFGKDLTPFEDRFAMCEALAALWPEQVEVSALEAELAESGRENRTVDTVAHLKDAHPDTDFALVIGSDLVRELDKWKEPERLRSMVRLIVVNRGGVEQADAGPRMPEVSSTWVRERLAAGDPLRQWVPRAVRAIVEARGLYREG